MKAKYGFEAKVLALSFIVIAACEVFFLLDVAADFFHMDVGAPWIDHGAIELMTTLSLAFALIVIGRETFRLLRAHRTAKADVQIASGELMQVIEQKFADWRLTASERDVALLLIKGMSNQEIADIRATRPGTVKAQSSAIYHKAAVRNRHELAAYFVEDLLAGDRLLRGSAGP